MSDPILITGVGRRAGLHLTQTLLQRGRRVIGTYRTERPSLEQLRAQGADLLRCDFYSDSQVARLSDSIRERYSALRAVIHNASDWHPDSGSLPPAEVMENMLRVHVSVPYRLNLALSPLLQASAEGSADIIHIGDYVSTRGSAKHIAYAASKAAQDNLTLSFATSLAPRIKVNSIAPALLLFHEGDDARYREKALAKSLLRREGGLDELRRAVDYLMDSRYVTGRILHVDGGRHLARA